LEMRSSQSVGVCAVGDPSMGLEAAATRGYCRAAMRLRFRGATGLTSRAPDLEEKMVRTFDVEP
jgi:hypothetical protein